MCDDALQNFTLLLQWCMQFKLEVNKPCSNKFLQEVLSLKPVPFDHIGVQSLHVAESSFIEWHVSSVIGSFLFAKELDGEAFERYIDGSDLSAVRSQTRLSIGI